MSVASNGDLRIAGSVYATSSVIGTPGSPGDLAEQVDILPSESTEAGDVMMVDPTGRDRYRKSTKSYSSPVAGVISTRPNIVIGDGKTNYKANLALVGRVPVKFSPENGPAIAGDLLVPASLPGYAMVYNPRNAPTGTNVHVVGIALEAANSQTKIYTLLQPSALTSRTQTNLSELQSQIEALNSGLSQTQQTMIHNPQTQTLTQITRDLDLNNFALLNTKSINTATNRWRISEDGYLETTVEGTNTKLRTVHSNNTQALFAGEGKLEDGIAIIAFNDDEKAIVARATSYHVLLTKTSAGKEQIQVTDKTILGFIVESVKGEGNATFDWVLLAGDVRVLGEQTMEDLEPEAELLEELEKDEEIVVEQNDQAQEEPSSAQEVPVEQVQTQTSTSTQENEKEELTSTKQKIEKEQTAQTKTSPKQDDVTEEVGEVQPENTNTSTSTTKKIEKATVDVVTSSVKNPADIPPVVIDVVIETSSSTDSSNALPQQPKSEPTE